MGKNFLKKALEGAGLASFDEEENKEVASKPIITVSGVSAPVVSYATPSDEVKIHLEKLLDERNLPGPDYLEFTKTQKSMASIIPVVEIRYKASFSALQAQGLTKEVLNSSATEYKNILNEELANFEAAFQEQYSTNVEALNSQIADKQKEAMDLSNQLMKLQGEVEELKSQARTNEGNLTAKRNEFASGVKILQQEIDDELTKINNTI